MEATSAPALALILTDPQTAFGRGGKPRGIVGFEDHLRGDLPAREDARACIPEGRLIACACRWRFYMHGCMHRDCAGCQGEVAKRRAKRAVQRINLGRHPAQPLMATTFTVPPALRAWYADKARWKKLARLAWKILKGYGALFGYESTHPCGDRDPAVFHPHLNFGWIRKGSSRQVWLAPAAELRAAWRSALLAGLPAGAPKGWRRGKDGELAVNLFHEGRCGAKRIGHRIRYDLRPFVGWGHWLPAIRWMGKYPKVPKHEVLACDRCGEVATLRSRGVDGERDARWWANKDGCPIAPGEWHDRVDWIMGLPVLH